MSLDETLERAKIWHTRAELALHDGDGVLAEELITAALRTFTNSRTRYDITHARVTLSRAMRATGQERLAIEHGSIARPAVLAMGYGLLNLMYPEEIYDLGERIAGALTAYACGDALGVPWENTPKTDADATPGQVEQLPAREGWPRGATSDDTALTLLAARHLAGCQQPQLPETDIMRVIHMTLNCSNRCFPHAYDALTSTIINDQGKVLYISAGLRALLSLNADHAE